MTEQARNVFVVHICRPRKIREVARDVRDLIRGHESVLFVNLTWREYRRWKKAHVAFSGAGGLYGSDKDGKYDPYIASFGSEVMQALVALGWDCVWVTKYPQWVIGDARKRQKKHKHGPKEYAQAKK